MEGSYVKNSFNAQHWIVSRNSPVKIILVQLEYFFSLSTSGRFLYQQIKEVSVVVVCVILLPFACRS